MTSSQIDDLASLMPLQSLRGLILLSGMVRPTPLSMGICRSVLELPIDDQHSVLDRWHEKATDFARSLNRDQFNVRVTVDNKSDMPDIPRDNSPVLMSAERDKSGFRGTGGVLRDLASTYEDNDYLLVVNAAQILLEPLVVLAAQLARTEADVALISHTDGLPTTLMLIRCGVLRSVPEIGYVDLKEQVLPKLTSDHSIRVVECSEPTGLSVRRRVDYLNALRYNASDGSNNISADPFAERWRPAFRIVEKNAEVNSSATLHDSVILDGARIERGALVVRSVICKGAVVKRNETVIDRLVSPQLEEMKGALGDDSGPSNAR